MSEEKKYTKRKSKTNIYESDKQSMITVTRRSRRKRWGETIIEDTKEIEVKNETGTGIIQECSIEKN